MRITSLGKHTGIRHAKFMSVDRSETHDDTGILREITFYQKLGTNSGRQWEGNVSKPMLHLDY